MHPLPSSQSGAAPPWQAPPAQVSLVVQALPSSQGAVVLEWTHPEAGLQESSVHPFLSSQFGASPPTQDPPEQVSLVVQALPSSQESVLSAWMHPEVGLQESSVHPLPSLQFGGAPPWHEPPAQVSLVVQALPSSHRAVLLEWTHPEAGLQESLVHPFSSSQFGAEPPMQEPSEQMSWVVQALPSLHSWVLGV